MGNYRYISRNFFKSILDLPVYSPRSNSEQARVKLAYRKVHENIVIVHKCNIFQTINRIDDSVVKC